MQTVWEVYNNGCLTWGPLESSPGFPSEPARVFTAICVCLPQVTLTQAKGSGALPAAACCDRWGETGAKKAGDRAGPLRWSRVPSRWGLRRVAGFPGIPSRLSVSAVTRPVDPAAHPGPQEPAVTHAACPHPADSSRPSRVWPDRKQPLGSVPSFPKGDSPSLAPAVHAGAAGERVSQERSPVATVVGPRRDAVDMDLRLDTENRLVLALLHLHRQSSTSGFFPAPSGPEVTRL